MRFDGPNDRGLPKYPSHSESGMSFGAPERRLPRGGGPRRNPLGPERSLGDHTGEENGAGGKDLGGGSSSTAYDQHHLESGP